MITVITVTIGGRELYLSRAITSVINSVGNETIQHIIVFNGLDPTMEVNNLVHSARHSNNYQPELIKLDQLVSIGEALNNTKVLINGDLVMKMDDDCLIQSTNFFDHTRAINKLIPRACFSPFPVGLIGNLGGVSSNERSVIYSAETDTYYTLRKVNHVGGFARISPAIYAKAISFTGTAHDEDGQFSARFNAFGMFYLENAIIVEHQESTLGQHERCGKDYFKGRF